MAKPNRVPQKRIAFQGSAKNKIPITKFDAARRLLETAVVLWFHDGDSVSVHTLTMAAHEILRVINKSRGGAPMLGEPAPYVREEYIDLCRDLMVQSYNFFKHSSQDGSETHLFPPEINRLVLLDATDVYHRLTNDIRPIFKVFKWYMRTHEPDFFLEPELDRSVAEAWSKPYFFAQLLPTAQVEGFA
jgi:hypothetical protein